MKQLSSSPSLSRLFGHCVQKLQLLTQYFHPRQFPCAPSPHTRALHIQNYKFKTPLLPLASQRELHFAGDFVRHEPVLSLQFRLLAPFGYLNLITSSIFGGLSRQIFPIVISCGGIAVAEFTSVGDQQHLFEKDCCFTCFAEEAIRFAKETLK